MHVLGCPEMTDPGVEEEEEDMLTFQKGRQGAGNTYLRDELIVVGQMSTAVHTTVRPVAVIG